MSRALAPLLAAALALAGASAATLFLHRAARTAVARVLDERLRGAGDSAALLLSGAPPDGARLGALMRANALDGAYLVDARLVLLADATGPSGGRVDLLRADAGRIRQAFEGRSSVAAAYDLGAVQVGTGYFPVRDPDGKVGAVLGLEAGQAFAGAGTPLSRARDGALGLSFVGALALALLAARWTSSERSRRQAAERAARGEAMTRMAAMAAHEIRNPLGVIRGTVELLRERSAASLGEKDLVALEDVLGEVERLRRLTEDFLDLSAVRPLALGRVDLCEVLEEAARATEAAFPGVGVRRKLAGPAPMDGDLGRLRQVFLNVLANAAQAQRQGTVELALAAASGWATVRVHDEGPGIAPEVRARLFDPFVSSKEGGTGLGLALSRRLVERHGGTVALGNAATGTTFEVRLPLAKE